MRKVGDFNNLSEVTKKKIKPLKPGEQAHYRLLNGQHDISSGEVRYGASKTIVCRDIINDDGELKMIGVPNVIEDGEVKRVKKFYVSATGDNILTNGVFTLNGSNLEQKEFYEFFELCNFNKSNPDRDPSVIPIIERIDEVAEAEAEEVELDTLTKALVLASQMSTADMRFFASAKNWNTKEHPALLKTRIKKYAQENPVQFLAICDDPESKTKVTIKQALDANIIQYVAHEHKITWGKDGSTIARLERGEEGETELDCFYRWLKEKNNGDNILKSIETQLKNLKSAK